MRLKLTIVCYLVLWTTSVTWIAAELHVSWYEAHVGIDMIVGPTGTSIRKLAQVIALPIAFYRAIVLVPAKGSFSAKNVLRYFIGAPIWIASILSLLTSLILYEANYFEFLFFPTTLLYEIGRAFLTATLATLFHCVGMLPLASALRYVAER